jgi:membrane protein DedA with SNARE-associated domain
VTELISTYGYFAVLVGSVLEGEGTLVFAGLAAARGYLLLPWVVLVAIGGTLAADQVLYWVGRIWGRKALERWPSLDAKSSRATDLLRRYDVLFILGFRYLYGLRSVSALVIGASGIKPLRFLLLDALSVTIWAVGIGSLAYWFGRGIEFFLQGAARAEAYILLAGGIAFAFFLLARAVLRRLNGAVGSDGE